MSIDLVITPSILKTAPTQPSVPQVLRGQIPPAEGKFSAPEVKVVSLAEVRRILALNNPHDPKFQDVFTAIKFLPMEDRVDLFCFCVQSGHLKAMQILLDKEMVFLNSKNQYGFTPIHYLAGNRCLGLLKALFTSTDLGRSDQKRRQLLNTGEKNGNTPLHEACYKGDYATVQLLMRLGADVNQRNHSGQTPFDLALEYAPSVALDLFEEVGPGYLNLTNSFEAYVRVPAQVQQKIIQKSPDFESQIFKASLERSANTRLRFFEQSLDAQRGDLAIRLIQSGVILTSLKNSEGISALHIAASKGEALVIQELLKSNRDVDQLDSFGQSALHAAVEKGNPICVRLLLQAGADYNLEDRGRWSPAALAMKDGHIDALREIAVFAKPESPIDFELCHDAYSVSSKKEEIDQLLPVKQVLDIKEAANIWGVKRHFTMGNLKAKYDGYYGEELREKSLNAFKKMAQKTPIDSPLQRLHSKVQLMEAISMLSPDRQAEEARRGAMIFIPLCSKGHIQYLLVHGNQVYFCNRGEGAFSTGVCIYEMQNPENLGRIIEKVRQLEDSSAALDYFRDGMHEDLDLMPIAVLPHQPQKVGNCPIASSHTLIHAILHAHFVSMGYSRQQAEAHSYPIRKWFTAQRRIEVLQNHLASNQIDQGLLRAIRGKLADSSRLNLIFRPNDRVALIAQIDRVLK